VFALLLVAASRCVPHPVGPARTYDAYVGKARTTAKGVASDVATVALVAHEGADGRALGTYVASVASDAEAAIGARQDTFASVQPPSEDAGDVGDELDAMLDRAAGDVRDTRVAARRGDGDALAASVPRLEADRRELDEFQARHR
jgi:hypothetical protein